MSSIDTNKTKKETEYARTVSGVGYDSGGFYKKSKSGIHSSAYSTWKHMLNRCYNPEYHKMKPTYADVTVCKEWHDYQVFAEWYNNQKNTGAEFHLDKDLINIGSREYSPNNCSFVPKYINVVLLDCGAAKGVYPQGVSFDKDRGRFKSQISIFGKKIHLGLFDTADEAIESYKNAKERHVKKSALKFANQMDFRVFINLMNWSL